MKNCFIQTDYARQHKICNDAPDACGLHRTHTAYLFVHLLSLVPQPVSLSDREVISRLRNCLLALAAHKVLLYDTSVLYCYESSLQHQVGITPVKTILCNVNNLVSRICSHFLFLL